MKENRRIIYTINDDFSMVGETSIKVNSEVSCKAKINKARFFIVFFALGLFFLLIGAIIMLGIGAVAPCLLQHCAKNSHCINGPFNPRCKCNVGYNGNGKDYCHECGLIPIKNNNEEPRIVGGHEAAKHSFPFAVMVLINYKAIANLNGDEVIVKLESSCGGTLIDISTVMTAAHCIPSTFMYNYGETSYAIDIVPNIFYPSIESMITVYVGVHKIIQDDMDISPSKAIPVASLIVHELYDDRNNLNDIALLKLAKYAVLSDKVQLACLPNSKPQVYPGNYNNEITVIALGWGVLGENGDSPSSLQTVKLKLYNPVFCQNSTLNLTADWDRQICAGAYNGGRDTCQGDSGGSLLIRDKLDSKTKFISIGIVSYGEGCARFHLPGVYTRVSYFVDWIEERKLLL